jgi:hypothetical protein
MPTSNGKIKSGISAGDPEKIGAPWSLRDLSIAGIFVQKYA